MEPCGAGIQELEVYLHLVTRWKEKERNITVATSQELRARRAPWNRSHQQVSCNSSSHRYVLHRRFDNRDGNWRDYIERFEFYCDAQGIADPTQRRALFLSGVGQNAYRRIKTILAPALLTTVSYQNIIETILGYFEPKPSAIVSRFRFHQKCQGAAQGIQEFVTELKVMADRCEFGPCLDHMLRDRFVCGLNHLEDMGILSSNKIGVLTARDATLSKVVQCINRGWPEKPETELKPFAVRQTEPYMIEKCIMWGTRVVIPQAAREAVLDELHSCHFGVVKMKALARASVWWPGVDKNIEELAASCTACRSQSPSPPSDELHPWQYPARAWSRLHIDFAGPRKGKYYMVLCDAFSKWIEVEVMSSIDARNTIRKLTSIFS